MSKGNRRSRRSTKPTRRDHRPRRAELGARLSYRYDLGDCWDHTVLLEAGDRGGPPTRPTCLAGRGDAPVEDWPEEEPPPAYPLDLAALDRRLAQLWAGS